VLTEGSLVLYTLTDQHHYMLELIAEGPIPAIPEIERLHGSSCGDKADRPERNH
jgi:hypothetical protein